MMRFYKFYLTLYENAKKINKALMIVVATISAVTLLYAYMDKPPVPVLLLRLFVQYGSYFAIVLLAKIFHKCFGEEFTLIVREQQTFEFTTSCLPNNFKISGARGYGKDSAGTGIAVNEVKNMYEEIKKTKKKLSMHLYFFDLELIKSFVEEYIEYFFHPSNQTRFNYFIRKFKNTPEWIKQYYQEQVTVDQFYNDYLRVRNNIREEQSDYIITNRLNYKHLVEVLFEYANLHAKEIGKNIIMANQPMIQEIDKDGKIVTAMVYSPEYKRVNYSENVIHEKKEYKKKVLYPFEDYLVILETEVDIWYSNLDSEIKRLINQAGFRNMEAIQRHLVGDHFKVIRIGQVSGRTQKAQRDLEEGFMQVIHKVVAVDGHRKRVFFLEKYFSFLESLSNRNLPLNLKEKINRKISKVQIKIDWHKAFGYIKVRSIFSDNDVIPSNPPILSLTMLLKRETFATSYCTELVFKQIDSWGRYDTKYMNAVGEYLATQSTLSIDKVPKWGKNMKMTRNTAKHMGYPQIMKMYNISKETMYNDPQYYEQVVKEPEERQ